MARPGGPGYAVDMRKIEGTIRTIRQPPGGVSIGTVVLAFALAFSSPVFAADQSGGQASASGEIVTLAQCVDQALATGPDILLSHSSLGIAQAGYTSAVAGNALGLTGSLSASQNSLLIVPVGSATGVASATAGVALTGPLGLNVGLNATHTITEDSRLAQSTKIGVNAGADIWDGYPGGSSLATAQKAALTLQKTQISEDSNRRTIVYQVKQSYYSLLAQQRQIRILQSTLLQRQEEMKKTQALYDAQSANQIDLKQAQVNQRQAELDLLKAQDGLEVSRQQLSALVGWPLDRTYTVAEVEDLPVPGLQAADAVKTALAQRSDMRQLQISQSAAAIDLALSRGRATPTVSASAGLDWSRDWSASTGSFSANAGLTVRGPIIDGGSAAAQAQQAELQAQTLKTQQDQLAATIATNVKSALASLRDLVARADLARSNLDLAQNLYDLTKIQFDSGVKSNLDVLAASVSLTTAQVSMAKARADAQLGVLALQNALGN